jgi:hypothetical protein
MVNLGWILLLYSPEMVIAVIEIGAFHRRPNVPGTFPTSRKTLRSAASVVAGRKRKMSWGRIQPELKLTDHYHMTSMAISGTPNWSYLPYIRLV